VDHRGGPHIELGVKINLLSAIMIAGNNYTESINGAYYDGSNSTVHYRSETSSYFLT
jgi:hypothetical protein